MYVFRETRDSLTPHVASKLSTQQSGCWRVMDGGAFCCGGRRTDSSTGFGPHRCYKNLHGVIGATLGWTTDLVPYSSTPAPEISFGQMLQSIVTLL